MESEMLKVYKINDSPYSANAYLIKAKKSILIDVGMSARSLLNRFNIKNYITPKDIELIILTHCHYDHTGAIIEIAEKTGAKIAIHQADAELLKDDYANVAYFFKAKMPPVEPDILFGGGEKLNIGDCQIEVLHTPGHTPGSICLYIPELKILFSGDTIFPNGGIGRTDLVGGSSEQLVESIKKIAKLDIKTLYPGHGEVTSDKVKEQIQFSLKFAEVNLRS